MSSHSVTIPARRREARDQQAVPQVRGEADRFGREHRAKVRERERELGPLVQELDSLADRRGGHVGERRQHEDQRRRRAGVSRDPRARLAHASTSLKRESRTYAIESASAARNSTVLSADP